MAQRRDWAKVQRKEHANQIGANSLKLAQNLMDANEIMKRAPDPLLLMPVGEKPLLVRKLRYYADKEFAGRYDDD